MRRNRWLFAAPLLWLAISGAAHAQQEPPSGEPTAEKEKTYFDLRRSNNRTSSLIAERYFALVRLQEWSDVTGKAKVTAKYLEHDPELQWVKLQMVRGRGPDRVVQEKTVPIAKLSKTCQSRVRQIALLQKKLDELLVAEPDDDGQNGAAFEDPGAPMVDERGVEPGTAPGGEVPYGPPAPGDNQTPSPAAPQTPTFIEFDDDPDPLGFAEVTNGAEIANTGAATIEQQDVEIQSRLIEADGTSREKGKDTFAPAADIVAASQDLALLATRLRLPPDDQTVLDLSKSLTTIRRFHGDLSAKSIAATVKKAHELIEREGKSISIVDVAALIAEAVPRNQTADHKFKFSEVTATLVGLIASGEYDSDFHEAAVSTRALCEELLEGAKKQ